MVLDGAYRLIDVLDLFEQIVDGVEQLHQHGVAHLDLKPHNLCLRFLGDRAILKVIDLGLADYPGAPLYLQQAQGMRQLDHDFAAPEVANPIERLPEVRYKLEGSTLLVVVSPRPLDAVNPFCPHIEPRDQITLVMPGHEDLEARVDTIKIGSDRLQIQATVCPSSEGWAGPGAGTASLVLHRACGQPGDIFSLGMLLVAMLTRRVDLTGYRESDLPTIRLYLESRLPALVDVDGQSLLRLLKRSQLPFQHFPQLDAALARFGDARFLAEELFGVSLRRALRGPKEIFYRSGRGAMSSTNLGRLRTDIERIRRAVTVLAARDEVDTSDALDTHRLGELRALLAREPKKPGAAPKQKPAFDALKLRRVLWLGENDEDLARSARDLVQEYGGRGDWLIEHLDALARSLDVRGGSGATVPELPLLGRLLPFAFPVATDLTQIEEFRTVWDGKGEPTAGASIVKRWREEHAGLMKRIDEFAVALAARGEFSHELNTILIEPCLEGFEALRRDQVTLVVENDQRERVDKEKAERALEDLTRLIDGVEGRFTEYKARLDQVLAEFDATEAPWKIYAASAVETARRQLRQLRRDHAKWQPQVVEALSQLRRYHEWEVQVLLGKWDAALGGPRIRWPFPKRSTTKLKFTVREIRTGQELQAAGALKNLNTCQYDPTTRAEVALALARLSSMKLTRVPVGQ